MNEELEKLKEENRRLREQLANSSDENSEDNYFVKAVNLKLEEVWSSPDYLMPYYRRILEAFLKWENAGDNKQKQAIKHTKNRVLKALEYVKSKIPPIINV